MLRITPIPIQIELLRIWGYQVGNVENGECWEFKDTQERMVRIWGSHQKERRKYTICQPQKHCWYILVIWPPKGGATKRIHPRLRTPWTCAERSPAKCKKKHHPYPKQRLQIGKDNPWANRSRGIGWKQNYLWKNDTWATQAWQGQFPELRLLPKMNPGGKEELLQTSAEERCPRGCSINSTNIDNVPAFHDTVLTMQIMVTKLSITGGRHLPPAAIHWKTVERGQVRMKRVVIKIIPGQCR
jgi:hypothetical protein